MLCEKETGWKVSFIGIEPSHAQNMYPQRANEIPEQPLQLSDHKHSEHILWNSLCENYDSWYHPNAA